MVIPVSDDAFEYATYVKETLHARGFHVEANLGDGTLNKKVREAQVAQFNYILVVGKDEEEQLAVNVRVRGQKRPLGTKGLQEFLEELEEPKTACSRRRGVVLVV
ncbi:Threonine--tRNA ligase [Durusdinium trenchii]|uniref:Mitochondrial 1 (AtSYT1) (Threonyl-tRNA synthetase) (ThrRS) n=1 Tax=Durusdinium trenchii TaxID=1381693 RepID=A0ABP0J592_9DINO